MRKIHSTDQLLTLGMALTTDKKAMERRVRGVFARKTSTKGVFALSLVLALALGFAAFTTACQPGEFGALNLPATTEVPLYLQEEILTSFENSLRARVLRARDAELDFNGTFPAPRVGDYDYHERGSWSIVQKVRADEESQAKKAFLDIANVIFYQNYQMNEVTATYYRDDSKVRADVWRIDSTDGSLSGALDAHTLQFISAQCKTIPRALQHESIVSAGKSFDAVTQRSLLDSSSAVSRIATALGATVDLKDYNSYQTSNNRTYGWDITETVQFYLDNGKFCSVLLFGDERLTPYALAVYPDADCFIGGVFWYADRGWKKQTVMLKDPIDFRVGEPNQDDMTYERAKELYSAFLSATGDSETHADHVATFYKDYSGARESFWHMSADRLSMNIASKSGHIFDVIAWDGIGLSLNLSAVAFTDSVKTQYENETKRILEAVLGANTITNVSLESISDDIACTLACETKEGARYSVYYSDRTLHSISYYTRSDEEEFGFHENWLADYLYIDVETGETFFGS
jgi:hypothetical protein